MAAVASANGEIGAINSMSSDVSLVTEGRVSKPSRDHLVFVAGAVSGIVEGVTIQPLELLKTRFQVCRCFGLMWTELSSRSTGNQ
jgi:hypothetical protein